MTFGLSSEEERDRPSPEEKHTFSSDHFGWVIATGPNGGMLKSQSVEAHLLYAILRHLETNT